MDACGPSLARNATPALPVEVRAVVPPYATPAPGDLVRRAVHAAYCDRPAEAAAILAVILADHAELPPSLRPPQGAPPRSSEPPPGYFEQTSARELLRDPDQPRLGDAALLACHVLYRLYAFDELAGWVDQVRRRSLAPPDDPLPELDLGAGLVREGRLREGRTLMDAIGRAHPDMPSDRRAFLLHNLGITVSQLGDFRLARDYASEAVAVCRAAGNEWLLGSMLTGHGLLELRSFSLDHGAALLGEAVLLLEKANRVQFAHQARFNLAIVRYKQGRTAEALALVDRCEDALRRGDNVQAWLQTRLTRCKIHLVDGRAELALAIAREVEAQTAARGFQREEGLAVEMQGDARFLRGDLTAARRLHARALAMARVESPDGDLAAGLQRRLAQSDLLGGDLATAHRGLQAALLASRACGEAFEEVVAGHLLATARRRLGDLEGARAAARDAVEQARVHGCTLELARALLAEARAEARLAARGAGANRETAWARAAEARQITVRLGFAGDQSEIDRFLARLREAWRAAWVWAGGPPPPESLDDRAEPAFVAGSPAMAAAAAAMAAAASSDDPVLIVGETGTGKEVAARRIHDLGRRQGGPLVAVNCAAIPADLFEREFFGHAPGAFTGAERGARGLVELANRGTLFLDEVGDLPVSAQGKLLRLLQEGAFRRLGDPVERTVDLRVIAATNVDLPARVAAGDFRRDLYYRLSVLEVALPPLRDRGPDVLGLVRAFVRRGLGAGAEPADALPADVLRALERYDWPGNVRELEGLVRRACLFARSGQRLPAAMVPAGLRAVMDTASVIPPAATATTTAVAGLVADGDDDQDNEADDGRVSGRAEGGDLRLEVRLEEAERTAIRQALAAAQGNRTRAAQLLGVSRKSLYEKLRRLGIAE